MDVLQKYLKDSKSFNWIIFGSQTYNNNLNRLFFVLWWINVLVFIILSSCSFSSMDTSSGFLTLPVRLTGRNRCYFITANRRNLICLFINIQAAKCSSCCPEDPEWNGCMWHTTWAYVIIYVCILKLISTWRREAVFSWTFSKATWLPELWELHVYEHVFNGNTASKPHNRRHAAVCQFRSEIAIWHWRRGESPWICYYSLVSL